MSERSDLSRDLKRWWNQQSSYSTLKQFADRAGVPYSSLKKYFAGQKWPAEKNRGILFRETQLELLKPESLPRSPQAPASHHPTRQLPPRSLPPKKISKALEKRLRFTSTALSKLSESVMNSLPAITSLVHFLHEMQRDSDPRFWTPQAKTAQGLLDALERVLRPFLDSPQALELLRSQVSGPDAGYLSGLLAALFDDKRLANWKAMTTYTYGGDRRGR